jgi:integrase
MELDKIGQEAVDKARATILEPDASPGTVRRNLITPLRAIMVHAAKRRWCQMPHFDLPTEPRGRTTFLMPAQADALLSAAAPHLRPLLLFLLGTGCRLGEALALEWSDVDLQAGRVILWEGETKSGARRVAFLPPAVVASMALLERPADQVFLTRTKAPYRLTRDGKGGGQIKRAWATACRLAELPGKVTSRARPDRPSRALGFDPDFTPHHLRHTWATWHYALHRDLLRLKVEGGWSSTALVERYAHIMPVGHEDAIRRLWGLWPAPAAVKQVG